MAPPYTSPYTPNSTTLRNDWLMYDPFLLNLSAFAAPNGSKKIFRYIIQYNDINEMVSLLSLWKCPTFMLLRLCFYIFLFHGQWSWAYIRIIHRLQITNNVNKSKMGVQAIRFGRATISISLMNHVRCKYDCFHVTFRPDSTMHQNQPLYFTVLSVDLSDTI